MNNVRLLSAVIASVIVTAAVVGIATRPAQAQAAKTAVCTPAIKPEKVPVGIIALQGHLYVAPMADWMSQQLAAGKTQFVLSPADSVGMALCAW